ncbi:MAG TPA: tripartite tricarboxylate transporter substrate binding protein [Burkholderiaceae bacterium]|nr:tripartite tricarboxylate transporter substrate binding protein [Burkholderiaceae bacterium]
MRAARVDATDPVRRRLLSGAGALGVAYSATFAQVSSKTLRIILTAPPGSSIDVLGRMVADQLRERLGHGVLVENRPAAGGTSGTHEIVRAAPDGTTIGLSFTGPLATAPFLYAKLPYDPFKDLAPIVLVGTAPNVLAVTSALPVSTFKEFISYARERPGQLNYASIGNGSASHLSMELLKTDAGLFLVHIPFNGAPPAVQATAAGDVHAVMSNPTTLLAIVQTGRIRLLAVTSRERWPALREVPTIHESGFAGFEAIAWNGFVAPAATPRERIDELNREINTILSMPEVKSRVEAAGWQVGGGTPDAFATFMQFERARWQPVIKRSGARLD